MNARQRFLATMAFEPVDHVPLWEWDYWPETLRVWQSQGAPLDRALEKGQPDAAEDEESTVFTYPWSRYLLGRLPLLPGAEPGLTLEPTILRIPLNSFICPLFKYEIIEEYDDVVLARDPRGHIRRDKRGGASISNIVKPLVANREDWERVKAERLALRLEGRLPPNWPEVRDSLKRRETPLAIGGHSAMFGFFHTCRYLMTAENLCYAFYEQPDLVKDMMNHLADLYVYLFDRVLSEIAVDLAFATEDIGYKTGPFISPATFREFMLPPYRRVTGLLRDHGVEIIIVDSDGNNGPLIPLFLEGGVTGMAPMEVAAGVDVAALREAFPRLQMLGGIDKRALAEGRAAIDEELQARVPGTLASGGYIPMLDHGAPPDVSWESFVYYRQRLQAMVCGS